MNALLLESPAKIFPTAAAAHALADILNADDEDAIYIVEVQTNGKASCIIQVFDIETTDYLGPLPG